MSSILPEIREILTQAAENCKATIIDLDQKLYFRHHCGKPLKFGFMGLRCEDCNLQFAFEAKPEFIGPLIHPDCLNIQMKKAVEGLHK